MKCICMVIRSLVVYVMHLDGGTICFVVLDVYFLGGIVGGGEFILVVCMWCILMGNCSFWCI